MGEAKRRREQLGVELTKKLADEGKLIESGFDMFASLSIPNDASDVQISEMKIAWMAGAEYTWSSMIGMLDPGSEPTKADLHRLDLIQDEIVRWADTIREFINRPEKEKPEFHSLEEYQRLGDGPVQEQYQEKMTRVMNALDGFVNGGAKGNDRTTAIVVLMAPFDETYKGRCNFMSNGVDRRGLVVLFKEMIARFEGQPEMSGRA